MKTRNNKFENSKTKSHPVESKSSFSETKERSWSEGDRAIIGGEDSEGGWLRIFFFRQQQGGRNDRETDWNANRSDRGYFGVHEAVTLSRYTVPNSIVSISHGCQRHRKQPSSLRGEKKISLSNHGHRRCWKLDHRGRRTSWKISGCKLCSILLNFNSFPL